MSRLLSRPSPPHSRQVKVGQQPPSSKVRVSSAPGPHSGGPWGQVVTLQTAGEAGAVEVPLPSLPQPCCFPVHQGFPTLEL